MSNNKSRTRSLDFVPTYDKTSAASMQYLQAIQESDLPELDSLKLPFSQWVAPFALSQDQRLTQGGFSEISTAILSDQRVVVKKLLARRCPFTVDVEKFMREVRILYFLNEPNSRIIRPLGWNKNENRSEYHVVLPFMPNGDLYHFIQRSKDKNNSVARERRLLWCVQLCEALSRIHDMNYVHCDVKSLNVLLDEHLDLYLTDFADMKHERYFSKMGNGASDDENRGGRTLSQPHGTVLWMSPEMASLGTSEQTLGPITTKSDIYSLGVVFYEIFAWKKPFEGVDTLTVMENMKHDANYRMELTNDIPEEIQEIISQCWQLNPLKRPSCQELISTLKSLL